MIVGITVDVDEDSGFRDRNLGRVSISRGEYGPNVGIQRLLNLYKKLEIRATFFIPGEVAERFPDACKRIQDAGHEIGHHGYLHKAPSEFSLEEEKEDLEKGLAALQKIFGKKPKGYRAPWLGQSDHTYRLLKEYGFDYDSSESGRDSPYFIPINKKDKLLEIPTKVELIDTPYFLNIASPGLLPFPVDPDAVEKIWKTEFSGMYSSGEELCFIHTVHPFCIAHFHRLKVYENLLAYIKSHSHVRFVTLDALSRSLSKE